MCEQCAMRELLQFIRLVNSAHLQEQWVHHFQGKFRKNPDAARTLIIDGGRLLVSQVIALWNISRTRIIPSHLKVTIAGKGLSIEDACRERKAGRLVIPVVCHLEKLKAAVPIYAGLGSRPTGCLDDTNVRRSYHLGRPLYHTADQRRGMARSRSPVQSVHAQPRPAFYKGMGATHIDYEGRRMGVNDSTKLCNTSEKLYIHSPPCLLCFKFTAQRPHHKVDKRGEREHHLCERATHNPSGVASRMLVD